MKQFGIDISYYQSKFNFKTAKKEGVKFVILRGAYHLSKDKAFESLYKKAKANGINIGCYIYSMATTTAAAKEEANFMINKVLKGKQFELPIYFDIEDKVQKKLSKATNTAIVKAFCETMEKAGYWVGIYASKSFFSSYLNDSKLQGYAHWIAQWTKTCTYKGKDGVLGMWQYGGETNLIRSKKVANYSVVDQDYMLVDYPTKIKAKGLNGFTKTKVEYYKKYTGKSTSIVDALKSIKVDSSFSFRSKIAKKNGIAAYVGLPTQNKKMLELLKEGKLIKI